MPTAIPKDLKQKFVDRFWKKVDRRSNDECWPWLAALDSHGYGQVGFKRTTLRSHRVAFHLFFGPFALELSCCHKCDNPKCCNPFHLFLGSHKENMQDMFKKKRRRTIQGKEWQTVYAARKPAGDRHRSKTHPEEILRGSQIGNAKFTEDQIIQIRNAYKKESTSCAKLGKQFSVNATCIHKIVTRKTWTHI